MTTIIDQYDERVRLTQLEPDSAQRAVADKLDDLRARLEASNGAASSVLARFFKRSNGSSPRGLYIHGAVGRGKTMLMDLFFEETCFKPKRRAHFHEFMADAHDRIALARAEVDGDPIPHAAAAIAEEARLLCFDELHVTDIADAMILSRLFAGLFAAGTTVVATSNAPPNELYKNGLNRQLFLPFIALLERHMEVVELTAKKDFRLEKLTGATLYFTPITEASHVALDQHWQLLTGGQPGKPATMEFKGRKLIVPMASMGVARFSFEDLCEQPLGTLDYLHIAHAFHTVMIDGIPRLDASRRNEARRFINLIDTLYDNGVCLIASAEAEPDGLYPRGDGADLFERTASRLMEMRSESYLSQHGAGRKSQT